ncbi:MAG TPA: hypothetical protein PL188_10005, partial [Candidatus Cloacimonadota bacterium]|nr:hypothetical protein [Candidatus Cloacimonadota bacterium]
FALRYHYAINTDRMRNRSAVTQWFRSGTRKSKLEQAKRNGNTFIFTHNHVVRSYQKIACKSGSSAFPNGGGAASASSLMTANIYIVLLYGKYPGLSRKKR